MRRPAVTSSTYNTTIVPLKTDNALTNATPPLTLPLLYHNYRNCTTIKHPTPKRPNPKTHTTDPHIQPPRYSLSLKNSQTFESIPSSDTTEHVPARSIILNSSISALHSTITKLTNLFQPFQYLNHLNLAKLLNQPLSCTSQATSVLAKLLNKPLSCTPKAERYTSAPSKTERYTLAPPKAERYILDPSKAERYTSAPSKAERYTSAPSKTEHYTSAPSTAERYTTAPLLSSTSRTSKGTKMGGAGKPNNYMCTVLESPELWAPLAFWEVLKMVLLLVSRYYDHVAMFRWLNRALLYSAIVFHCYVSSFIWMTLLFLYFHNLECGGVLQLVIIFVSSLMNAIFCFIGVYYNIKHRPHHTMTKEEAKVMFQHLIRAVPEVRFQLYSFKSVVEYEENFEPDVWFDQTQDSSNYFQLEQLLDMDTEFVSLLKLEVRPYDKKTAEEYKMVLYRFAEKCSFHLNDIQILSIVEEEAPSVSIALTSSHSTRILIVNEGQKQNSLLWFLTNIVAPYFGTYRNYMLRDQSIRLSVVKSFK